MGRYLIAGAGGYVGSRLAEYLLAQGHYVRGLVRDADADVVQRLASRGMAVWQGDLTQPESLIGVANGIERVFNLTARSVLENGSVRQVFVDGNCNLIAACSRARSVRSYVFTSNVAAYGDRGDELLTEDTPVAPSYPLGEVMVEAEQAIMELVRTHNFPAIILRVSSVYGPGRDFVDSVASGTATMIGDGRNYLSHIHIDDLVFLLEQIALQGQPGALYNLAILLPATCLAARRLQDTGRNGMLAWALLIVVAVTQIIGILTALSLWWFDQIRDIVPNHTVETPVPAEVAGRAMVCQRLDMFPVECVARGYLTGSGLVEYNATGDVCGVPLPPGLVDGSRLPEPIFTPATKAELGLHDENVSFDKVVAEIGLETATALRELTLRLYSRAHEIAASKGIILADTKFEFGTDRDGRIIVGDEVLTPDSSRFWPAAEWEPGHAQPSYDKQFVRDWLTSPASGWDRNSGEAPPPLPDDVVERTRQRYLEAYDRLAKN